MDIPDFVWGFCSVTLTLIAVYPYIYKTLKGNNRPHVFTWVIWTLLTGIAFAVQFTSGAGAGSWATGVTSFCCLLILLASLKHGTKNITRFDWICFIFSMLIVPIWFVTESPALAAILVTAIDGLGYFPTCRKVWSRPHEEVAFTHLIMNIKHMFSLMGMGTYTIATAFYPVSLLAFNFALVIFIFWRRRKLGTVYQKI
jgi:hypothetical protein